MEQNILKRYNEIHTMLWEEVLKAFSARTSNINDVKYYKENGQLSYKLNVFNIKRTALFHLCVRGKITEEEEYNLLANANCAACYVAHASQSIESMKDNNYSRIRCVYCPIKKWNTMDTYCHDYYTIDDKLDDLTVYISNCIDGKEKFSIETYMSLRKAIIKKMYILAHLEWGYE